MSFPQGTFVPKDMVYEIDWRQMDTEIIGVTHDLEIRFKKPSFSETILNRQLIVIMDNVGGHKVILPTGAQGIIPNVITDRNHVNVFLVNSLSTKWFYWPPSSGSGSNTFSGLDDTTVTNPTDGEGVIYSGGKLINNKLPSGYSNFKDLLDTNIVTPKDGDKAVYSGGKWINYPELKDFSGATPAVNFDQASSGIINLTANIASMTITGGIDYGTYQLLMQQDAKGGHTVVWPSNVKPPPMQPPVVPSGMLAVTLLKKGTDYKVLYQAEL